LLESSKNSSKRPKANTRMEIPAKARTAIEISSHDALSVEERSCCEELPLAEGRTGVKTGPN